MRAESSSTCFGIEEKLFCATQAGESFTTPPPANRRLEALNGHMDAFQVSSCELCCYNFGASVYATVLPVAIVDMQYLLAQLGKGGQI